MLLLIIVLWVANGDLHSIYTHGLVLCLIIMYFPGHCIHKNYWVDSNIYVLFFLYFRVGYSKILIINNIDL